MTTPAIQQLRDRMQESILAAAAQDPSPDHTEHERVVEGGVHYAVKDHLQDDHGIDLTEVMGGTMSLVEIHDRVHGRFTEVPDDAPVAVFPSGQYRAVLTKIDRRHGPVVRVEQRIEGQWHGTPGNYHADIAANLLTTSRRFYLDVGANWFIEASDAKALGAFATLLLALYGKGQG